MKAGPSSGSEVGVYFVLIQTSLLFICKYKLVSMITYDNMICFHSYQSSEVCNKQGQLTDPASLLHNGQVTEYTTVKL